jgi:hypothetical protein
LGSYAKKVSAGLDASNKPEVYVIGADNAVWVNHGSGWVSLGGCVKEISATINNALYVIGTDAAVYLTEGTAGFGFVRLGGGGSFKEISAGADEFGNHFVFAIGADDAVYRNNNDLDSWIDLGGYAKQISSAMNGVVYAIGGDNAVYENNNGGGWISLGGYAKQISAAVTSASSGGQLVFAIGLNDGLWSNQGSGWVNLGGYVTEVIAPAAGNVGINLPGGSVFVAEQGHKAFRHKGANFSPILDGTVE